MTPPIISFPSCGKLLHHISGNIYAQRRLSFVEHCCNLEFPLEEHKHIERTKTTMKLTQVLSFGAWCLVLNYVADVALTSSTDRQLEEDVTIRKGPIVRPYSLEDIAQTAPNLRNNHPRLLVFNGQSFAVYNLNHKRQHYRLEDPFPKRSGKIIPLLVHALKELNPNRFLPGQPVFQLLFMDSDSIGTDCFNSGTCPVDDFCPILMFGSTPANETHLPTVKAYPNWFFMDCLYNYKLRGKKHCQWPERVVPSRGSHHNHKWEDLQPTVVWRGKDFGFLGHVKKFHFSGAGSMDMTNATSPEATADLLLQHWDNLGPRWRAAALTAKAEMHNETWIDAKFVGVNGVAVHKKFEARGVQVVAKTRMEPTEMAHYKYLIDFGGGGGEALCGMCLLFGCLL